MRIIAILFILFNSSLHSSTIEDIKIGLVFRFTDDFNKTSSFMEKGFMLAKEELETKYNVKIKYLKYSHDDKLDSVIKATRDALNNGVKVIIGGENSDQAIAIARTIKNNAILITPTATSPSVTKGRRNVFRTCISDTVVAKKMALFVHSKLKEGNVGVLQNVSYPYSNYLSEQFIFNFNNKLKTASPRGRKLYIKKTIRNNINFEREVLFFKKNNVKNVVLLTFQSDFARFLQYASQEHYYPTYIGSDGWGSNKSLKRIFLDNNSNREKFNAYRNAYWRFSDKSEKNKKFKKSYKKKYNSLPNAWAAQAYDTANVVIESALSLKGKKLTVEKMRKSLVKYTSNKLLTSEYFKFGENNTPYKKLLIYKISSKHGVKFHGKF